MWTVSQVLFGLLGFCVVSTWCSIPSEFVMRVGQDCGSDAIEDAKIVVTSDLEHTATAVCAGGVKVVFVDTDTVHLVLHASYPGQGSLPCVFEQRGNSQVYVLTVLVAYGEPGQPVHQFDEEFTITCTFDLKGHNSTSPRNTSDTLIAPREQAVHAGVANPGTEFQLTLTNVLGEDFTGKLATGRVVQLKVNTSGDLSEQGVAPEACDAVSSSGNERYPILRGGCGDGLVFGKDKGFTTKGTTSLSPLFETFTLAGDPVVKFECNFTLCLVNCDGNTCTNKQTRKKRIVSSELSRVETRWYTLAVDNTDHENRELQEKQFVIAESQAFHVHKEKDANVRSVHV